MAMLSSVAHTEATIGKGEFLDELRIGALVNGKVTRIFRNRVWVDIGMHIEATMLLPKRISKASKVGDILNGCVVVSVDLESDSIVIKMKSGEGLTERDEHDSMVQNVSASKDELEARWLHDTTSTFKFYQTMSERFDVGDSRRYGWSYKYGAPFMNAIYLELTQLIPQGVTRVLDLGCGGGEFAKVLHEERPGVRYLGVDLFPSYIDSAREKFDGVDGYDFNCVDFWTFLLGEQRRDNDTTAAAALCQPESRIGEKWDFVISCGGVFSHCNDTNTSLEHQLQLLDAIEKSASRGFILICHGADSGQGICMGAARRRVATYETHSNSLSLTSWSYVSPVDGRGWKPCLKKIQYKHRLIMILR